MERLTSSIKTIIAIFEAGGYRMRDRTKVFVEAFMKWGLKEGSTDHDRIPILKYEKIDPDVEQISLADRDFIIARVDKKKNTITVTEPDDAITRTILNYMLVINKKNNKYSVRAFPPKTSESKKMGRISKLKLKI